MLESKFSFNGKDGTEIVGYKWFPDNGQMVGIMQIVHGSIEHAKRYKHFAEYLTEHGIGVYIHDQRGHGETAGTPEKAAYFSDADNGWNMAIDEIFMITDTIKKAHPDTPVFLLGHSMGAIEALHYGEKYGTHIDGLIVSGAPAVSGALKVKLNISLVLLKVMIKLKRKTHRSPFMHGLVYEGLQLSRDPEVEKAYAEDPFCGNLTTLDYIFEMLKGSQEISRKEHFSLFPKELPVYFFVGEKDKVGGSKAVPLFEKYKSSGVKRVDYKVYKDCYHETLNELNKDEVYGDILTWIKKTTR